MQEIRAGGAISFARFMELALYCPVYGYYEKEEDTIGRRGDFYTSVSVGDLFGELLAFQFSRWLEEWPMSNDEARLSHVQPQAQGPWTRVRIVEAGAHRGQLAKDILTWLREHRPELFGRLRYCIVEPSLRRRAWQQRALDEFAATLRWAATFSELTDADPGTPSAPRPAGTVIFANELLDALPMHRVGWDARKRSWFEWGVTIQRERFIWTRMEQSGAPGGPPFEGPKLPPRLLDVLPDGFVTEICPAARGWWVEAARALHWGKLLTFDYGHAAEELLQRAKGTLRAYRDHHISDEVLEFPGEQDITASVDFSALLEAGESAGLRTEAFEPQGRFLTRLAAPFVEANTRAGQWPPQRVRQFQTLTHPDHLGASFRVLVQSSSAGLP